MSELEKLQKELDETYDAFEKKNNSIDCTKVSFDEYNDMLRPYYKKMSKLEHEIAVLEPVEWSEIPDYGDLFTMKDWLGNVEGGGFIDYDGYGHYSDGKRVSNKEVQPSHVKKGWLLKNPEFTHVVWYNR